MEHDSPLKMKFLRYATARRRLSSDSDSDQYSRPEEGTTRSGSSPNKTSGSSSLRNQSASKPDKVGRPEHNQVKDSRARVPSKTNQQPEETEHNDGKEDPPSRRNKTPSQTTLQDNTGSNTHGWCGSPSQNGQVWSKISQESEARPGMHKQSGSPSQGTNADDTSDGLIIPEQGEEGDSVACDGEDEEMSQQVDSPKSDGMMGNDVGMVVTSVTHAEYTVWDSEAENTDSSATSTPGYKHGVHVSDEEQAI